MCSVLRNVRPFHGVAVITDRRVFKVPFCECLGDNQLAEPRGITLNVLPHLVIDERVFEVAGVIRGSGLPTNSSRFSKKVGRDVFVRTPSMDALKRQPRRPGRPRKER